MDVSPFLPLVLIAGLSVLLLLLAIRKPSHNCGDARRRLPPSPPGLPIIGHLPFLGSLPHRKFRSMAASYGPVMLLRLGRVPTVVASSAATAQEVMKTRDLTYASRPKVRMAERLVYGRDMAFAPYGEHWRQARRVCVLHLLSQRRVHSFRHDRKQEAAALIGRVRSAGDAAVNLTALLISYTNGIISRAAFGDDGSSGHYGGEKLTKLFADFEELLGTVTVGEFVPWLAWVDTLMGLDAKVTRTYHEMDALLDRVIEDHRQRRRVRGCRKDDDHRNFVDVLLDVNEAAEAEDMFDNASIKDIVQNMFAAGTDTTYTTLVWAMAELINHPHEMRKVQDEIRAAVAGDDDVTEDHLEKLRYLKCIIKETLRLRTPVPLLLPHETYDGGHGTARLPRPSAHPRRGQRLGHRPGPRDVGARRGVRAGAVRRRGPHDGLLARAGLQVRAVWRREERMPRGRVRCANHGAGAGELAVPLRLGAAGRRGAEAGDG